MGARSVRKYNDHMREIFRPRPLINVARERLIIVDCSFININE